MYEYIKNKEIINYMSNVIKRQGFISFIKYSFEYICIRYTNDNNITFISENEYPLNILTSFGKAIEIKKQKLIEELKPFNEIEKEINNLVKICKNFIKDIKGKGKLKEKKLRNQDKILCNY